MKKNVTEVLIMSKILYVFSLITCILYLQVGLYTYKLNPKSKICKLFFLLNILLSIWSFAFSFEYLAESSFDISFWYKLSSVGWCSFASITLYLVLNLTKNKFLNYFFVKFLVFLPAFVTMFINIFFIDPSVTASGFFPSIISILDFSYNFIYLLLSIILIYFWGKKSLKLKEKKQARLIFISSVVSFLLNLSVQTILPAFGIHTVHDSGQFYALVMVLGVCYAIKRYQFLRVPSSLITEELLTEIMDLTFIVDPDGNITNVNKKIKDILGYDSNILTNTSILDIIKEKSIENLLVDIDNLKNTIRFNKITIFSSYGESIPFSISVTPLIDSITKELLSILIVGHDMRIVENLQNEIKKHNLTSEKLKKSNEKIEHINNKLLETNTILKEKACRDGLTNLYNHQHINELLKVELIKASRSKGALSLMMLDIDFFKVVNDNFGHQIGDKVLVTLSNLINSKVDKLGISGRYGGEEFIILLPNLDLDKAYEIANDIRISISQLKFEIESLNITVSIGVCQYDFKETSNLLINRADNLLYKAKKNGRNRVEK